VRRLNHTRMMKSVKTVYGLESTITTRASHHKWRKVPLKDPLLESCQSQERHILKQCNRKFRWHLEKKVYPIVLSHWGTGRGTCVLETVMILVTTLGISALQAPDIAKLLLKSCFHCTPYVSESIIWVWKENVFFTLGDPNILRMGSELKFQ
jgi:hypothetical protein